MHAEQGAKTAPERKGWRLTLSWPMMLLAGWAVYELTAQSGLAVLATCFKLGWPDLRTAFWLRRVGPDRRRGRTCFWSYLAFGLWKVAAVAIVFLVGLGLCEVILWRVQGRRADMQIRASSFLAGGIGLGSSFVTTYLALFSALRNGTRLWMGSAPSRARRERFWPPCHRSNSWGPLVFLTTLVVTFSLAMLIPVELAPAWALQGSLGALCVMGTLVITLLWVFTAGYFVYSRGLFATYPQECWTCTEDEEVHQHDLPASSEGRG